MALKISSQRESSSSKVDSTLDSCTRAFFKTPDWPMRRHFSSSVISISGLSGLKRGDISEGEVKGTRPSVFGTALR